MKKIKIIDFISEFLRIYLYNHLDVYKQVRTLQLRLSPIDGIPTLNDSFRDILIHLSI